MLEATTNFPSPTVSGRSISMDPRFLYGAPPRVIKPGADVDKGSWLSWAPIGPLKIDACCSAAALPMPFEVAPDPNGTWQISLVAVLQSTCAFAATQAKHPTEIKIIFRPTFIIFSFILRFLVSCRDCNAHLLEFITGMCSENGAGFLCLHHKNSLHIEEAGDAFAGLRCLVCRRGIADEHRDLGNGRTRRVHDVNQIGAGESRRVILIRVEEAAAAAPCSLQDGDCHQEHPEAPNQQLPLLSECGQQTE